MVKSEDKADAQAPFAEVKEDAGLKFVRLKNPGVDGGRVFRAKRLKMMFFES